MVVRAEKSASMEHRTSSPYWKDKAQEKKVKKGRDHWQMTRNEAKKKKRRQEKKGAVAIDEMMLPLNERCTCRQTAAACNGPTLSCHQLSSVSQTVFSVHLQWALSLFTFDFFSDFSRAHIFPMAAAADHRRVADTCWSD